MWLSRPWHPRPSLWQRLCAFIYPQVDRTVFAHLRVNFSSELLYRLLRSSRRWVTPKLGSLGIKQDSLSISQRINYVPYLILTASVVSWWHASKWWLLPLPSVRIKEAGVARALSRHTTALQRLGWSNCHLAVGEQIHLWSDYVAFSGDSSSVTASVYGG